MSGGGVFYHLLIVAVSVFTVSIPVSTVSGGEVPPSGKGVPSPVASADGPVRSSGTDDAARLAEVEALIEKAWRRDKTLSAQLHLTVNNVTPEQTIKIVQDGSLDIRMKNGVFSFRTNLTHTGYVMSDLGRNEMQQTTFTVCDGVTVYTVSDGKGAKSRQDESFYIHGGKPMLDFLKKDMSLRFDGEAKIDGHAVFTMVSVPYGAPKDARNTVTTCFAKDTGIVLKQTNLSESGEIVHALHLRDIKLNPTFPKDHFKFTPPAGMVIQDLTNNVTKLP